MLERFPQIGDLVDAKSPMGSWCEAVVLAHRDCRDARGALLADPAHAAGNAPEETPQAHGSAGDIVALVQRTEFFVHFKGWSSDLDGWVAAPASMAVLHTHTQAWRENLDVGNLCEANFGASARGRMIWRLVRVSYVSRMPGSKVNSVCVTYVPSEGDGGSPPFSGFWLDASCDRLCALGTHIHKGATESESDTEGSADELAAEEEASPILANGLAAMWKSDTLTDFVVHVGQRSFKVHKLVLAARSEMFRTMLTVPLREAAENEVSLDGLTPETFERVLEFVYTGRLDPPPPERQSVASLFSLVVAADRFDMPDLIKKCEGLLKNCLHVDNVVKVLALARRFSLKSLQEVASEFFVTYARRILQSEEFGALLSHAPVELDDEMIANPMAEPERRRDKRATASIGSHGMRAAKRPKT